MTKTFTPNDVIRFIYGEIDSACEKNELINELNSNNELAEFYFEMKALNKSLNKIKREPSRNSISHILEYSKNFNTQTLSK